MPYGGAAGAAKLLKSFSQPVKSKAAKESLAAASA